MTIQELMDKRAGLVKQAQGIMDKAGAERRELDSAEDEQLTRIWTDVDKIANEIKTLETAGRRAEHRSRLDRETKSMSESAGRAVSPERPGDGNENRSRRAEIEFRGRKLIFEPGTPEHRRSQTEYREAFRGYLQGVERRDLQSDLDVAGGYVVAPEQFVAELIKDVDDEVLIRQYGRKFVTNAASLGAPRRVNRMSSFAWGSELSAPVKDTALSFGKRSLAPHYMTGEILVSRDLLQAAVMDVEGIVRDEIARDAGELEEKAFMSGNGAQQPLGLFVASPDGIPTTRDESTGNTSTAITMDGLINAFYKLKAAYQRKAMWLFHRDAVKQIRTLKDSQGRYLWEASTQIGQPDTILGRGIIQSEFAPNTFTTGQYVGLIGDFDNYWIVDGTYLQMQMLVEKYSESNQVAWVVRRKLDAAPVKGEAFTRVKLG